MSICQMHVWSSYFNMLYNPVNYITVCEFETFTLPTDAHNVKKHRVIKTF